MGQSTKGLGAAALGLAISTAGSAALAQQVVAIPPGLAGTMQVQGVAVGGNIIGASLGALGCGGMFSQVPQHRLQVFGYTPQLQVNAQGLGVMSVVVRTPGGQVLCQSGPSATVTNATPGYYDVYVGVIPGRQVGYVLQITGAGQGNGVATVGLSNPWGGQPAQPVQPVAVTPGPWGGQPVQQQQPGWVPVGGGMQQPMQPMQPVQPVQAQRPYQPMQPVQPMQPMQAAGPSIATLFPGFMPDPAMFNGTAGGRLPLRFLGNNCRGFGNQGATMAFTVGAPMGFVRAWVRATGDTTLAIRTPTGQVFCADDTYGSNPGIDMQSLPAGRYEVFVGSYNARTMIPFEFALTERQDSRPDAGAQPMQQPMQQQPQWGAQPVRPTYPRQPTAQGGYLSVSAGFMPDPRYASGVAGGPVSASSMFGSRCSGYVNPAQSHTITVQNQMQFLRVFARSQGDTTIIVRGPNGDTYCADDTFGNDPGVDLSYPTPGNWQVFVGSYSSGDQLPYTLGLTERNNFPQ